MMDKISYALGMSIAQNLASNGIQELDYQSLANGLKAIIENEKPALDPGEANKILQDYFSKLQSQKQDENLKKGEEFLQENAKREGVVTLESGLQYEVIKEGEGDKPKAEDQVKCHYHGTLIDGTVFDSSVKRGEPAVFPVNGVIQGWVEALQIMKTGSKWRLFIPSHLAYGSQGAGGVIGPDTTLVFEVELISIQ